MEKKKKTKRMRELVELLNKARRAYEQENHGDHEQFRV